MNKGGKERAPEGRVQQPARDLFLLAIQWQRSLLQDH